MRTDKWVKLDDLREPGMRRVLEALKLIEEEAPGLLDQASVAAAEPAKRNREGGLGSR
jgi:hypothetical protein